MIRVRRLRHAPGEYLPHAEQRTRRGCYLPAATPSRRSVAPRTFALSPSSILDPPSSVSFRLDGFVRYEVNVRYSNGDKITGEFEDKSTAVVFLRGIR